MGLGCSCFGQSSSQRLPKQNSDDQSSGQITSIVKFMICGCVWRKNEIKRRDFHRQEKQQLEEEGKMTLKECLVSSPPVFVFSTNKDEFYVLKQPSTSSKVYPSLAQEYYYADCASNKRGSFSKEKLLKAGEGNSSEVPHVPPSGQSQSGKKRVRFRQPEEADIFIYSPSSEETGEYTGD